MVDKQQTIILLDNVGLARYQGNITNSIINVLNGQPFDAPKRSLSEMLYKTVKEKDVAAAIIEYRKLKTENAAVYDFSENELNTLGYQLLGMKRAKDAIEILKLNVEMFPKSANPYDSLGEAYLADNQKELALANYKKAVELDPANTNAAQIVNRLEGKETKIDSSVYESYVGEYELPDFILTVTREGDKLMGQPTGQEKLELKPVSQSQFVVPAVKANVSFEKDSAGKITGLILTQGGRAMKAKKIK